MSFACVYLSYALPHTPTLFASNTLISDNLALRKIKSVIEEDAPALIRCLEGILAQHNAPSAITALSELFLQLMAQLSTQAAPIFRQSANRLENLIVTNMTERYHELDGLHSALYSILAAVALRAPQARNSQQLQPTDRFNDTLLRHLQLFVF